MTLFKEERAAPAVPTFLRKTQVSQVVPLSALGGGRGVDMEEVRVNTPWKRKARREGRAPLCHSPKRWSQYLTQIGYSE